MRIKEFYNKHEKEFLYFFFIVYAIINFLLMVIHEPWRDEIRAWIMAKYLNVFDLFVVSRFEGHPVLWHLLLMPFAKLNCPIITLNIISYVIVLISAWLFLFKTKINGLFKIIILFTTPFIYVFSSISRNYCLILLLVTLIGINYKKRYESPIRYSILISLLIHTHSLAWGIVAGLTISFHVVELIKYLKNRKNVKNNKEILGIFFGLIIIAVNTILVLIQLYSNTRLDSYASEVNDQLISFAISLIITFTFFILFARKNWREFLVVLFAIGFQVYIYLGVYGSVLLPKKMLLYVIYLLFFILIAEEEKIKKAYINMFGIIYLILIVLCGGGRLTFLNIKADIYYPYSSAKEMATFINENLNEDVVLVDQSIFCQTIQPYLKNVRLYDIVYEDYLENNQYAKNESKNAKLYDTINNIEKYKGYYIVIATVNNYIDANKCDLIYRTKLSISGENYSIYYIK